MKFLLTLPLIAMVAACADSGANFEPILDGPPQDSYQSDLAACQALARNQTQLDDESMGAAVLGAATGAALGALESEADIFGGAVAGALFGGIAGAVSAHDQKEAIVMECLRGRGHRVVG